MTQITYIKSSLRHSSALTAPEVALTQFGLWKRIKKAFKKIVKPLAAVVGIVASIAVPFIAPAVAGLIFGGTALATGAIGAAIAGAGLGAAAGALTAYGTGQNVLMGAGLGLLGGGLGGGIAGYAGSGGAFLGQTAGAAAGAAPGTAGALPAGAQIVPTSAAIGSAGTTAAGTVGVPVGAIGSAAAGAAGTGAAAGIGSRLLTAALQAAPGAIGSLVSGLTGDEAAQAQAELEAEMARLQQSDLNAYQRARELYDTLVAEYGRIDPAALAQRAEADVQRKVAQQSNEALRGLESSGGASGRQYAEAEQRRLQVEGAGLGSTAYGDEYYRAYGTKLAGLAGLRPPEYGSRTAGYLATRADRAEGRQTALASDISGALSPFALALAPRDTTLTSEDEEKRRSGLMTDKFASAMA